MMNARRFAVVACAAVAALALGSVAHAQTAAALVLETPGAGVPGLQPYREIPVGATLSLSPDARLVFLHYESCQAVGVTGGTITFGARGYTISGGRKEFEIRRPCPRRVTLRSSGEVGGILLRSLTPSLTLSAQPAFVLVGPRARKFVSIRFSQGDATLLEVPLQGRPFRWPSGLSPLTVGAEYELTLVPASTGAVPVTMRFKTTAPVEDPTQDLPTVITVE